MKRVLKIFLYVFLGIFALTLSVLALLANPENQGLAQKLPYANLVCDESIPTGDAFEESLSLMQDTYRELQNTRYYLRIAIDQLRGEVSKLYQSPGEICDFAECWPQVIDQAPDFELRISYGFGSTPLFGFHFPFCKEKECLGEPCPDLGENLKEIIAMRDGIKGSYEIIKEIYNSPTIAITEDIKKTGETVGTLIRRPESAKRKLQLTKEWLTPTFKGKASCVLTESERKAVAAGELGDRFPMKCTEGLSYQIYWPRLWSEKCQTECKDGPTDACKTCLGKCEGTSALAQINCKIYGTCQDKCQTELTEDCLACLCSGPEGPLSEEECIAWVCGGSSANWVCCHQMPLERE